MLQPGTGEKSLKKLIDLYWCHKCFTSVQYEKLEKEGFERNCYHVGSFCLLIKKLLYGLLIKQHVNVFLMWSTKCPEAVYCPNIVIRSHCYLIKRYMPGSLYKKDVFFWLRCKFFFQVSSARKAFPNAQSTFSSVPCLPSSPPLLTFAQVPRRPSLACNLSFH